MKVSAGGTTFATFTTEVSAVKIAWATVLPFFRYVHADTAAVNFPASKLCDCPFCCCVISQFHKAEAL